MMTNTENKEKAKIGLSWAEDEALAMKDRDYTAYMKSIELAGAIPVYLPEAKTLEIAREALKQVKGIVIAGGEDIDPKLYGEEVKPTCEKLFEIRDVSDYNYIKAAMELDLPLMATCRGMQMLNVVCGGSLYQDIFTEYDVKQPHRHPEVNQFTYHEIEVDDNNIMADALGGAGKHIINSWHHQAVKELGDGIEVVARSEDGIIEGIVYTKGSYCYGVQFHPEFYIIDENYEFIKMFKALVDVANK